MIELAIVDDSNVMRHYIGSILNRDPEIKLVGVFRSGAELLAALSKINPDLVLSDVAMPGINGFELTRSIMATTPARIVLMTASWRAEDTETSFLALEAGALAIVEKPQGHGHTREAESIAELIGTVKMMARVPIAGGSILRRSCAARHESMGSRRAAGRARISMVAAGASTGGPGALKSLLLALPLELAAPVVCVQHIGAGFLDGLARWLAVSTGRPVEPAQDGRDALPGHVYLAPDGVHTKVRDARFVLEHLGPVNGVEPSIGVLFESVAAAYGREAVGILLTGMGKDGAQELGSILGAGGRTFAQSADTCTVFGMPRHALELGTAQYAGSPSDIGRWIGALAGAGADRGELQMGFVKPIEVTS